LNPGLYESTIGYQAFSRGGIASGNVRYGFGKGVSKYHYLPEAPTDFAYAILAQETGFKRRVAINQLFQLLRGTGTRRPPTAGAVRFLLAAA
jgi:cell division protein FtsW